MDLENIFRDVKLSKTEMTVLRFIQNDPEQCVREGIRAVAEHCYSNPSSLVRLAKKLKFSGWLELVYFIKFNITMPKLDVTNDIDYMSIQPIERITSLLESLQHHRILIHGSGFSQLIAQYIYNKFLVTGVNASLALWPDYEILEQKNAAKFDSIWIISKSGRSSSALNWVKALEGKKINLVCFTGDYQSPLLVPAVCYLLSAAIAKRYYTLKTPFLKKMMAELAEGARRNEQDFATAPIDKEWQN